MEGKQLVWNRYNRREQMEGKQLVGKRYSRRKADGGDAARREEIQ